MRKGHDGMGSGAGQSLQGMDMLKRWKEQAVDRVYESLSTVSPVLSARLRYRRLFDKPIRLRDPRTLNEKISWLKLYAYGNDPLVSQCADKYRVREYVRDAGCGAILNELYGVWDSVDEIPWEQLPESFVLKCNHGCGYNLLCHDKSALDLRGSKKQLRRWMREDFWKRYAELQYRAIPKKILCERYLDSDGGLTDYKIYCFMGRAEYIMACTGRERGDTRFFFFDRDWKLCPLTRDAQKAEADFTLPRPVELDQMLTVADRLCKPFSFVRVDLYDVDGKVVFGELTFTPSGGLDTHRLPETDDLFGDMLQLPGQRSTS